MYVKRIVTIITHAATNRGWPLTSDFLKVFFAEVAEVNAEALNIKSVQPRQKH